MGTWKNARIMVKSWMCLLSVNNIFFFLCFRIEVDSMINLISLSLSLSRTHTHLLTTNKHTHAHTCTHLLTHTQTNTYTLAYSHMRKYFLSLPPSLFIDKKKYFYPLTFCYRLNVSVDWTKISERERGKGKYRLKSPVWTIV